MQRAGKARKGYRSWDQASGLGDRLAAGPSVWIRSMSYGRRGYSSQAHDSAYQALEPNHGKHFPGLHARDARNGARRRLLDSIAHHFPPSPFQPPIVDLSGIQGAYPKKTQRKFTELDKILTTSALPGGSGVERASGAGNLHTGFHAIANAERVFLCAGSNAADGIPQIDGPIATALLAYALYQVHKVAIIVADRSNLMLVRRLLGMLNEDAADHIRYVEVNAVNGMLVEAMDKLIARHEPGAIVHVGVPGRARDGLHYDAQGNFVGEYNMAIDQVMNLANAFELMTLAVGHNATQAGMKGISRAPADEDMQCGLQAAHQIVGVSATSGALALSSLLMAAYKDADLCQGATLQALIDEGREAQHDAHFLSPPVSRSRDKNNSSSIYRKDASGVRQNENGILEQAGKDFPLLQEVIHAERLPWTQTIEEQKLYRAKQRYISLVDSSDGVLIAAKRFYNQVRARSPFVLKMLLVADHKKAPYGPLHDEERPTVVYKVLRYTAGQISEVIVIACNTANLEDIDGIRSRLEAEAKEKGRNIEIHIIDLIRNTVAAIVARGGSRVVLLSTEGTARHRKYPDEILRQAKAGGIDPPFVTMIGCGDKNNISLSGKDWAKLINLGHYLDSQPTIRAMLEEEINRYVDQIPLDSTSVWLCCTHFPAIRHLIEARLKERLWKAGCSHTIPIYDPMEDQADATIEKLIQLDKGQRPDYSGLPRYSIHTSGSDIEVRASAIRHGLQDAVIQTVDFDGPQGQK
jgi:glutamate racemase